MDFHADKAAGGVRKCSAQAPQHGVLEPFHIDFDGLGHGKLLACEKAVSAHYFDILRNTAAGRVAVERGDGRAVTAPEENLACLILVAAHPEQKGITDVISS